MALAGGDPAPGLVAFSLTPDGRSIRVWRRTAGTTASELQPFSPFLLLADRALATDLRGLVALERLDGAGELTWLARFERWHDAVAARDRCRERSGVPPGAPGVRSDHASAAPYRFLSDPTHQHLITTGCTSFRGLAFTDLTRLAIDIEVVTTEGFEFPSATRPGDRIVAIAVADTTGFVEVLRGDERDETELLIALGRLIHERDPDVIEGHNIFRFDLEYLEARARRAEVSLAWGRDGSMLRGRPSRLEIAGRAIAYRRYEIPGRHVVDTWILAQLHDVGARDLPSYGLKDIARHLGAASADRTYVDAARVAEQLAADPDRLMAYAADDARETLAIGAVFSPPYFAQAQIVPFDYQATVLRGAAGKIDGLLMREYLTRRRAVPLPRPPAPVGGAHVAIHHQGVARPVLHVDVTSLYPSLMLAQRIAPAADDLGAFLSLLGALTEFRVRAKREASAATTPAERTHLGAVQQSFKILINAFYGYLVFSPGHWNDFGAADRVTAEGRRVVEAIIDRLGAVGAVPLEADTDGVYFVPPAGHEGADDEALLAELTAALPVLVHLELDGRFEAMLSYKLKTYALLDRAGRMTVKGSAFRSRGLEPFQRRLIEELVGLLLADRGAEARAVVDRWLSDFAAHRVPPRLFARTETLQEPIETYRERVASGTRPMSAAYELAFASSRPWSSGDQISYYVVGRTARVSVVDHAKRLTDWNPDRPDENVEYYQSKVLEIWNRLKRFAEHPGLQPYEDDAGEDDRQLSLF